MDFFAVSGLLNGIAATSLAILVYSRSPRDPRHWSYGLLGLSIGIWSFAYFSWQLSDSRLEALVFCRLLMAGAIFIPVTQLHHVLYLTNDAKRRGKILASTYWVGGFFLLVDATPFFVADVQPTTHFAFWPQPGPLFHVFLVWWCAVALYSCYLLALAYRTEKGLRKKQFFYLLMASGVAYLGGSTNFPLWYGIEILPYGTICFTFYVALIAYTLLRYHLMDFSVFVEKGLSYLAVLLLISQPAYPVLLLAQKSVFGAISYRYSMVQLLIHLLTVAGAYQMRLGTRRAIARSVLKGQDSTLKMLSEFSTNISAIQDMKLLGAEIVQTLRRGMRTRTAMLFVLNEEQNRYVPVSDFGQPCQVESHVSFAVTDDLPRYLAIIQTRVVYQELKQSFPDQWKQMVLKDLQKLRADVCFPFIRKNRLLGFCLMSPCDPEYLEAAEALEFVSTMLREAAMALENAILREEVSRSRRIVRHMDRLRSLETMSAGLAHQLTHPQTSIKAFVQLAQLRKNDEEFLGRFQEVLSSDVKRIEKLTKEIQEYFLEETNDSRVHENLNELIESCITFISLNPDYRHVQINTALDPDIPELICSRQEMRQVVFNMLLYHLNEPNRSKKMLLHVQTQATMSATGEKWVQVQISNAQDKPSFDVLLPFIPIQETSIAEELDDADLVDQGLVIAREIVRSYDGYIQSYGSSKKHVLFRLSLPVQGETRNHKAKNISSRIALPLSHDHERRVS